MQHLSIKKLQINFLTIILSINKLHCCFIFEQPQKERYTCTIQALFKHEMKTDLIRFVTEMVYVYTLSTARPDEKHS